MISFPNCKINLGLTILQKRNDGYHDLESVFYPLLLKDIIEVVEATDEPEFSISGLSISGTSEDNLCFKAYTLLKKDHPELPPVKMYLHKTIPMGAGLGGGSADASFMLSLLNKKFNLGISSEKLIDYSLQLGSDCPFFILNKPSFATGRGENLDPIELNLSNYKFFVVVPDIHINTAWAFSQLNFKNKKNVPGKIKELVKQPVETWKDKLSNDFEAIVFQKHPEIAMIKEKLYKDGAVYSSLSGSGSAVYGIFEKGKDISMSFPANYFVKELYS